MAKAQRAVAKDPLDQDAIDRLEDVKQKKHDREEELYFETGAETMQVSLP